MKSKLLFKDDLEVKFWMGIYQHSTSLESYSYTCGDDEEKLSPATSADDAVLALRERMKFLNGEVSTPIVQEPEARGDGNKNWDGPYLNTPKK